ncbi:uncharacterized protein Bfra_012383 [Botrytis fragariae]|uniref:Uncharacterized protein n=1 Tax=Botrytis fragariae TaxID=1964551 RepID=A0A8H6EDV2_9HELO|nr:uncharacterized protein Bfra_012383 [Botrytis fragariae]KAF5868473.1 hypothetical protein Bfra_012383 [Botrytis fragariae]
MELLYRYMKLVLDVFCGFRLTIVPTERGFVPLCLSSTLTTRGIQILRFNFLQSFWSSSQDSLKGVYSTPLRHGSRAQCRTNYSLESRRNLWDASQSRLEHIFKLNLSRFDAYDWGQARPCEYRITRQSYLDLIERLGLHANTFHPNSRIRNGLLQASSPAPPPPTQQLQTVKRRCGISGTQLTKVDETIRTVSVPPSDGYSRLGIVKILGCEYSESPRRYDSNQSGYHHQIAPSTAFLTYHLFISLSRLRHIYLTSQKADLIQRLLARFHVVMVPETALKKHELGAGCIVKLRRKKAENTCEGICSENRCPNFCTQCLNGCDDTAKHCKLEKMSYGHPALVLGIRERHSTTYVTFVIISALGSDFGTFQEFLNKRGDPGALTPCAFGPKCRWRPEENNYGLKYAVEPSGINFTKRCYLQLQHRYTLKIDSFVTFKPKNHPGTKHAYGLRFTEDSYCKIMKRIGLEKEKFVPTNDLKRGRGGATGTTTTLDTGSLPSVDIDKRPYCT